MAYGVLKHYAKVNVILVSFQLIRSIDDVELILEELGYSLNGIVRKKYLKINDDEDQIQD